MKDNKKVKSSVQPCPCVIDDFIVQCEHSGRKVKAGGTLQIVATTDKSKKDSFYVGVDSFNIQVEQGIDYGGSDTIQAKIIAGGGCDEKIKFSGGSFGSGEWKAGATRSEKCKVDPFFIEKKADPSLKLDRVNPVSYQIVGSTLAGTKSVTVEQYPSDKNSYNVKVDGLNHLVKKFNEAWEKWGETAFSWSPATIIPKLSPPVGSLTLESFWKEDPSNWQVFHEVAVSAGVDPLFGIAVRIEISLAVCALGAVGVPPPMAKLAAKHLADVIVGTELGLACKALGNYSKQRYTTGIIKKSGKLTIAFDGHFLLAVTARIGSDYVLSCAVTGEGKITISNENELNVTGEKLSFQPSVKLKPIELSVVVKTRAFYVFSRSKTKAWKLWKEDVDLWTGQERVLIDIAKQTSAP